jgi:pimeloyl-ACP methyl ester carboxylesterase
MKQRDDGKWTWKADPLLLTVPLSDMESQEAIDRYWRSLEAIRCPIMEVRGLGSPLLSDDIVERMCKANPLFSNVDVEDAGHVVPVDKPEEFIQVTRGFLGVGD